MKLIEHLKIVPNSILRWTWILPACASSAGAIVAYTTADAAVRVKFLFAFATAGLVLGGLLAFLLVSLAFVWADARQRAMQPLLWVLIAALFPHLLGFLLYFVLRQPISTTCHGCGSLIQHPQRFCPWCGVPQVAPKFQNAASSSYPDSKFPDGASQ